MASGVLTYDEFKCRRCGACCKNQKAVLLTLDDIFRLSERLGMQPGVFYKRYCLRSGKFSFDNILRIYLKTEGGCPFLQDGLCSVYDARPIVCAVNPFYYFESSLAAYRVLSLTQDECSLSAMPYDMITKGDVERLVDMDILVGATDEYMDRYGKFDKVAAAAYREKSLRELHDKSRRSVAYAALLDQAVHREDSCRNDTYYIGAMGMYLSGFYRKYLETVEQVKKEYRHVVAFQPSALGVVDGQITVMLSNKEYLAVKKALGSLKEAEIHTTRMVKDEIQYLIMSISNSDIVVLFYYYADPEKMKLIQRTPGELLIDFREEKGGHFIFRGTDADAWLTEDSANL
jgi:uncharacterized protein